MFSFRKTSAFISYAREDSVVAMGLYHFLKGRRCNVWIDKEGIGLGPWEKNTKDILENSHVIIPILSINYFEGSGYIQHERVITLRLLKSGRPVFPMRIDEHTIPPDFKRNQLVENNAEGKEKLYNAIVAIDRRRKIKSCLILFLIILSMISACSLWRMSAPLPMLFNATIFERKSNEHISGAIAYMLNQDGDTIIKSNPSGMDGKVSFSIDTTPGVRCIVWYYHPAFKKAYAWYWLMDHEPYRPVRLDSLSLDSNRVSQEKNFSMDGFLLNAAEEDAILKTTGYHYRNNSTLRFLFAYDRAAFVAAPIEGTEPLYRFTGSSVFLVGNGCRINTNIWMSPTSSLPKRKSDLDQEVNKRMVALVDSHRDKIITALLLCLHQN